MRWPARRRIAGRILVNRLLQAVEQQTMTITQAIGQLEEAAASLHEPGVASTYRQTIERVRGFQEGTG